MSRVGHNYDAIFVSYRWAQLTWDLKIVIEIYRIVNRNKGEKKLQLCFHFEL